jgi:hypothetical protein
VARNRRLEVLSYRSTAEGTLSTAPGESRFISFLVRPWVEVRTEQDKQLAEGIFASLARGCFIGMSLKAEPLIDPHILVREVAAPQAPL